MPPTEPTDDDRESAQIATYALREAGFIIDLLELDGAGVRLSAHRDRREGAFLTRRGYRELL